MAIVEIRLPAADVFARLNEIESWLDARGIKPAKITSTGARDEMVIFYEFEKTSDAEEFAGVFSGSLIG